ncbi:SWIM zinc finger family protein [Streptomyces sp. Ru87]|uniref:SWIM zinc finger family protein n=1 Tax=Streptomyces sp. Ru87 TaxID=2044307 RepID=UPI000BF86B54|nr:SWIM zinc finger family protein [Streptomyces sp. Ru87]PGH48620.1 hypothetical protein CRI70_22135 [Streptomyces sp. Ru87]
MTRQGERWTADQVLALAPDAASRKAGSRLGAAGPWSETGCAEGAVWGLCKGSGSKPYRTVVDLGGDGRPGAGPAYKCGCPSRKFPCKHALGLLLLWTAGGVGPEGAEHAGATAAEPPDWAGEWLTGRRQRAAGAAGHGTGGDAAPGPGAGPKDAEAARRRAERRAERMAAGASELEQRLLDLVRGGLAGADRAGYGAWEETAARMVDAQAPGLETRVRELGAIAASGPGWPGRLLEECSLLHLLNRAFLDVADLPDPLAATVRVRAGAPVRTAGLLAHRASLVRDRWLVLSQRDDAESRLTVRRIWLRGTHSGRTALVLSFGAAGRAPEISLPTGLVTDAECAFYPGAGQLRAAPGGQFGPPTAGFRPPGTDVGSALTAYGAALRDDPWLESWPVVLADVVPIPAEDGATAAGAAGSWQLADGEAALPVDPRGPGRPGLWQLVALSGGGPLTVFGECGHRGFTPLTAWSPDTDEAVPL